MASVQSKMNLNMATCFMTPDLNWAYLDWNALNCFTCEFTSILGSSRFRYTPLLWDLKSVTYLFSFLVHDATKILRVSSVDAAMSAE